MISVLLALLSLVLLPDPAHAQAVLTGRLRYGPHPVGFRVVRTVDAGRSYLPALDYFGQPTRFPRGRPMQVALWYPAKSGSRPRPMRFGEYLGLSAADADFSRASETARQSERDAFLEGSEAPARGALRSLLDENTAVLLEAAMAAGDWPSCCMRRRLMGCSSTTACCANISRARATWCSRSRPKGSIRGCSRRRSGPSR